MIREIENTNGKYIVHSNGFVFSKTTNKFLKNHITSEGYCRLNILRKSVLLHRLIALAFIPNPEKKRTINHKDGNKLNNNVENLEWATDKENLDHSFRELYRRGSQFGKKGVFHNRSCKTIQKSIDGNVLNQFCSRLEASQKTGVHKSNISMCIKGKRKTAGGFVWQ